MYDIAKMQTGMDPAWIEKVVKGNPAVLLPSGNIRLPPARGAFVNVAKPAKDKIVSGQVQKGSYGMNLLFTPDADLTALRDLRAEKLKEFFPKNPTGAGLSDPIKDQGINVAAAEGGTNKKGQTYGGFVPGSKFIGPNANLDYKPTLSRLVNGQVEVAFGTPEELEKEFYSGAWYIATVSCFHGRNEQNPNAFFGLSSVLKIADDKKFSGGGGDGVEAYAGINIDPAGIDPSSLF